MSTHGKTAKGDTVTQSQLTTDEQLPSGVSNSAHVRRQATEGMVWMLANSVLTKLLSFVQLTLLAYLLTPADYAPLTMASTFAAFAFLPLKTGLEDILVQRKNKFHLWAGPAFWMSLTLGMACMVLMWVLAPLGGWFYQDGSVTVLIVLASFSAPLMTLATVPGAQHNLNLRFRFLSLLGLLQSITMTATTTVLALLSFKAASVLIGTMVGQLVYTVGLWQFADVRIRGNFRMQRWKHFLADAGYIQATRLMYAISANTDLLIIGKLSSSTELGIYSYAFNQSLQSTRLFATNAASVLFPSLTSLGSDSARQYAVFAKGMVLIAPILIPLSMMQAMVGEPMFQLLFKPEWWPGIPYFQLLSLSMAGGGVFMLYNSFFSAVRRNDLLFWNGALSALWYLLFVPIAWFCGGVLGVSLGVGIAIVFSVLGAHWLTRYETGSLKDLWSFYGPALLISGVCNLLAYASSSYLQNIYQFGSDGSGALYRFVVSLMVFTLLYVPLLKFIAPETWRQFSSRSRSILIGLFGRRQRGLGS
ncbi:MAG: oligosaccharide flippase family protein [Pirellula sp.]